MAATEQSILDALKHVIDPHTGKDFVSSKCIKNLKIDGDTVHFNLEMGYPAQSLLQGYCEALAAAAQAMEGVVHVEIQPSLKSVPTRFKEGFNSCRVSKILWQWPLARVA